MDNKLIWKSVKPYFSDETLKNERIEQAEKK